MAKECTLNIGKLPPGGLPRNTVVKTTDCPELTSAVTMDVKQKSKQTNNPVKNKKTYFLLTKLNCC